MDSNPEGSKPPMGRVHARRLREIYRSAGWPVLDTVEIELVAAGHLERVHSQGHDLVRVTNAGMQYLAAATRSNRKAFSAHEALVEKVAQTMGRDGRIVWTNLSLRAWLEPDTDEAKGRWKMCRPDVFSIRNSSVLAANAGTFWDAMPRAGQLENQRKFHRNVVSWSALETSWKCCAMHRSVLLRNCLLRCGWHWQRQHRFQMWKASWNQVRWGCESFHIFVAS
jgi:hypothetical protein